MVVCFDKQNLLLITLKQNHVKKNYFIDNSFCNAN